MTRVFVICTCTGGIILRHIVHSSSSVDTLEKLAVDVSLVDTDIDTDTATCRCRWPSSENETLEDSFRGQLNFPTNWPVDRQTQHEQHPSALRDAANKGTFFNHDHDVVYASVYRQSVSKSYSRVISLKYRTANRCLQLSTQVETTSNNQTRRSSRITRGP